MNGERKCFKQKGTSTSFCFSPPTPVTFLNLFFLKVSSECLAVITIKAVPIFESPASPSLYPIQQMVADNRGHAITCAGNAGKRKRGTSILF